MPDRIGTSRWPVTCAQCGKQFEEELRRFEAADTVHCPHCNQAITLGLDEGGNEVAKARRLLDPQRIGDDLRKKLGKPFKG